MRATSTQILLEVMMGKYDKKEQIKDAIGLFLMVPVAYVLVVLAFSL